MDTLIKGTIDHRAYAADVALKALGANQIDTPRIGPLTEDAAYIAEQVAHVLRCPSCAMDWLPVVGPGGGPCAV